MGSGGSKYGVNFRDEQEKQFFMELLCSDQDSINDFGYLFDFREPKDKRSEFNRKRSRILAFLIDTEGANCILHFGNCDLKSGYNIDHIIPISTNIINKHVHKMPAEKGKKVKTESYGSNDIYNLRIACQNCNLEKKHRFLTREEMKVILENKEKIYGGEHVDINGL